MVHNNDRTDSWCGTCEPYLYSGATISKLVKTVRQLGFFIFNKLIVKRSTVELLKPMDCILKVCYDLQEEMLHVQSATIPKSAWFYHKNRNQQLIVPLYLTLCGISDGPVFRRQRNTSPVGKTARLWIHHWRRPHRSPAHKTHHQDNKSRRDRTPSTCFPKCNVLGLL